jgi:hypothetical protein
MPQYTELAFGLGELIGKYKHDPYGFVLSSFAWGEGTLEGIEGPDTWQTEQLLEIGSQLQAGADPGCVIRQAVASGHGIGKSALVSWLILWALCTFIDTRGVVTANTETQLKTKTWAELSKWYRLCFFASRMFQLKAESIVSRHPEHSEWRIDQVAWSLRNTEAFQGLHNKGKRILLIFDEGSGIPDKIWEVSEGALTDAGTEIIWCVFSNPTRNTGRFKDCFTGVIAKRWKTKQIDSRTSAFSNKEQLEEWITDYGIDSDFVKVRVRGLFPNLSARQFISLHDVDEASHRHPTEQQYAFAPKVLCVDPAWEGDDELVIGIRQGLAYRTLRVMPKNDNDLVVAEIVAKYEDRFEADAVFIDAGYGTGIVSAGRSWKRNWRLVWFGAKSTDPAYFNKRAQMWGAARDWLKDGGALPPNDTALYNDLIGPETVGRTDGVIQLEPKAAMKARGLRSPNRADCLAISFAYPVSHKDQRPRKAAQAQIDYDPLNPPWEQDQESPNIESDPFRI